MQNAVWAVSGAVLFGLGVAVGGIIHQDEGKKQDEPKKPVAAPAAEAEMPMPKPGKEHQWLKQSVGAWKTTSKMWRDATSEPMTTQGTAKVRMLPGDLFVIDDYDQIAGPGEFHGHGILGYDPFKKKFVGVWVDSMGTDLMMREGTLDATGKILTETVTGTSPADGSAVTMRWTTTRLDDKHHRFAIEIPLAENKYVKILEIDYAKE